MKNLLVKIFKHNNKITVGEKKDISKGTVVIFFEAKHKIKFF
jgi:hypothetical protein